MKAIIIFVMLQALSHGVCAQDSFKPWNADVAVGDETLESISVACPVCSGHAGETVGGIYDSFTGGANLMIRIFQLWISPLDGPNCRFRPTCSAYGAIAVRKHGAFLGGVLAGDRILRCNPFTKPGEDPVPDVLFDR